MNKCSAAVARKAAEDVTLQTGEERKCPLFHKDDPLDRFSCDTVIEKDYLLKHFEARHVRIQRFWDWPGDHACSHPKFHHFSSGIQDSPSPNCAVKSMNHPSEWEEDYQ